MTPKELFEAIGLVDDSLIMEADAPVPARPRPDLWLAAARRAVPLAACLCLVAGTALALRGSLFAGGASGAIAADQAAPRSAETARTALPEPAAGEGADTGGALAGAAAPEAAKVYDSAADGALPEDAPESEPDLCALPPKDDVMYWSSQLEPGLQAALWAEGEPESWQSVLAGLTAEAQPDAEPDALPVLCDGEAVGEYALISRADAQTLLFDGVFLSDGAMPRGVAGPDSTLDAGLVYSPAGAALRVPMWAFTVPGGTDGGDAVCYVPAVDLETLRALVPAQNGG